MQGGKVGALVKLNLFSVRRQAEREVVSLRSIERSPRSAKTCKHIAVRRNVSAPTISELKCRSSGSMDTQGCVSSEDYTIIIGHRRAAAAQQAGVYELPCAIVEMDEREQMQTMMIENMQRSDLTVYEQAQASR